MNTPNETKPGLASSTTPSRRSFVRTAALAGAAGYAALAAPASALSPSQQQEPLSLFGEKSSLRKSDRDILVAAEIAEALAVTTYSNIISSSPFFKQLPGDDQDYLKAAVQEEMSHYLLEQSVTDQPSPFTEFFYPPDMFSNAQTTLNILVTLEDAFIADYLVGVRNFTTQNLRVTSARIMGIESDHRTLARVDGGDVTPATGGPINFITGIQGVSESIDPPNNNGYERTLCWTSIDQAVNALLPFVDFNTAKKAGFNTSLTFPFVPFTPTLPSPLGQFISFAGC